MFCPARRELISAAIGALHANRASHSSESHTQHLPGDDSRMIRLPQPARAPTRVTRFTFHLTDTPMKRFHFAFPLVALLSFIAIVSMTLTAEDSVLDTSAGEIVAYRLSQWKEMHFDDPAKAERHMRAVQKLGCEAWQESHSGHIDIVYRCADWRTTTVQTHEDAAEKLEWLRGAGFDTHHSDVHRKFRHGDHSVQLRLIEWKVAHLTDGIGGPAKELTTQLHDFGCEIRSEPHDDHIDLSYRCPIWTALHTSNGTAARKLQAQLSGYGFETKHAKGAGALSSQ